MASTTPTVLVADDDPHLLRLVQRNLELARYRVVAVSDGTSALEQARISPPDVFVLDVMMPDMDGREVCRRLREFSVAPVLMLSAKDGEHDKVTSLDMGADDYVTKPFGAPELLARVQALLRRAARYAPAAGVPPFRNSSLTVDFAQHQAFIDGHPVNLTPTEYRILAYLTQHAGRVATFNDILGKVWGPAYRDETHLLRVNIARLRQKIEPDPGRPVYVLTRPGIGYLAAAPQQEEVAA